MSLFNRFFLLLWTKLLPYSNFFSYALKGFNAYALKYPNILLKKIIYVNPKRIVAATSLPIKPKAGALFFLDGDWDKKAKSIEYFFKNNYKFKSIEEIYIDKKLLEDTSEFKHVDKEINLKGSYRGYKNAKKYLESLHVVYESIIKDGYKKRTNASNPWIGEVEVALGRDGKLIKINSGNHRFACAYFFEIKEIPVNLCVVHSEYIDLLKKNGIKQFSKELSKIINAI